MGRNTLCWVDVSHYDGESCQRTLAREGARVLKVKVSRPHYKVNRSHRTQLTTSPRLPSQELPHTTAYTESIQVLTDLRFKLGDGININININIDLLISYKVHQSLSKGTRLTAFALIVYGR